MAASLAATSALLLGVPQADAGVILTQPETKKVRWRWVWRRRCSGAAVGRERGGAACPTRRGRLAGCHGACPAPACTAPLQLAHNRAHAFFLPPQVFVDDGKPKAAPKAAAAAAKSKAPSASFQSGAPDFKTFVLPASLVAIAGGAFVITKVDPGFSEMMVEASAKVGLLLLF